MLRQRSQTAHASFAKNPRSLPWQGSVLGTRPHAQNVCPLQEGVNSTPLSKNCRGDACIARATPTDGRRKHRPYTKSGCGCGFEPPLRFHRATCRPYTNPHKCKTGTSLRGPRAIAESQARGGPLCTRSLPANGRCSRSLFSVSRDNMAPPVLRSVNQSYPVHIDVSSKNIDASMV